MPTKTNLKTCGRDGKKRICYNNFIFNTANKIFGKMRKKTRIRALKFNWLVRCFAVCVVVHLHAFNFFPRKITQILIFFYFDSYLDLARTLEEH